MAAIGQAHGNIAIHRFGGGRAEGGAGDAARLGTKGANLAEMTGIGLPVPPGFTLPVAMGARFLRDPASLHAELSAGLRHIEQATGRRFGDPADPLLVSVRSGARVSMPGMMDTVLNIGLTDTTAEGLARASGDARFAWDSYRRLIQGYAGVVLGLDGDRFEEALEIAKDDKALALDAEMTAEDWRALVARFRAIVADSGATWPSDVHAQLRGAIGAVLASWQSDRAAVYRRLHGIAETGGTAVTVQAMVFGNRGAGSVTGVAFTRDPATGARAPYGEYLPGAQGEDVVSGIRTPHHLTRAARVRAGARAPSLEEAMPAAYGELAGALATLERHWRDMQDVEFTIEQGRLWLLQTRAGKRTGRAALRIAVDMAREGLITRDEAIMRVDPATIAELLRPVLDSDSPRRVIARGLPASPGAATGRAVFDAATAAARAATGEPVILFRAETSPDDIAGMHIAQAIVTARGGLTSHAAVVARGIGRPCITGASGLRVDPVAKRARSDGGTIEEGDLVTVDGGTGAVILGAVRTVPPAPEADVETILRWANDAVRQASAGGTGPLARIVTLAAMRGAEAQP